MIEPHSNPRAGWAEAFAKMTEQSDDALLDGESINLSSWDNDEWEWEWEGLADSSRRARRGGGPQK